MQVSGSDKTPRFVKGVGRERATMSGERTEGGGSVTEGLRSVRRKGKEEYLRLC